MAHLLNATRFKSPNPAVASFTVTIPTTTAGSTLVCIAGGGATIAAHLGGTTGTLFTARVNSLATRQVIAQDLVDTSGGTTTIGIVLNGAENIDGMIYEFAAGSLGAYIDGKTNGDVGGDANVNSEGQGIVGTLTTTGAAVLFMMFTAGDGISTATRQWWGMEPLGKQSANEYIATDASKSHYWSMIGMSAQSAAGTFNGKSTRNTLSGEHQSIMAAYTDNQPGTLPYTAWPNAIAAENSLPGVDRQVFLGITTSPHISGYTDQMSYSPGSTVNFKIFSENTQFRVDVYRFGFYGYPSFSGRRVASITGTPAIQPAPTVDSYGATSCAWSTTATWAIPATATPGVYFFQMVRTDNTAYQAQGIFVVRSAKPASKNSAKTAIVTADVTWQAYNLWGGTADTGGGGISGYSGRNLYDAAPAAPGISGRAFAVSYDRPMGTGGQNPVTYFWDSESALINFLEGNGYDLDYYSSIDLEQDPTILSQYGVAVCSGHAEYWTANMRNAYENARDVGTNLAFFSSNTSLWRTRFASSDTNKRKMICYKDSADTTGYDNTTKYDPVSYTGTWRDNRTTAGGVNNTSRRPESGMTGMWFVGNGPYFDWVAVPNSYRTLPMWRNTSIATGVSIALSTTNSGTITTAGTSLVLNQPTNTAAGDLIIVALTLNGNPGSYANNGARLVRQTIGANQSTIVFA
ncbi:MAG TPA: N,N-dimethylformamidase beta subunit family domain-containing protein, partial [Candidatus Saccharimonadales bacterium]